MDGQEKPNQPDDGKPKLYPCTRCKEPLVYWPEVGRWPGPDGEPVKGWFCPKCGPRGYDA